MGAFDDLIPVASGPAGAFDDLIPNKGQGKPKAGAGMFDDLIPPKVRTWGEASSDTAIDLAKGVVGLGESVVGLTDLATGNTFGKGWAELGFDPARTKQILSEFYSESRQDANRNVADAKGFLGRAKALIDNPSAAVGSVMESAPMMVGGAGAVRAAATKMLAARGLVAGSSEAAAFLSSPAAVARLTAIGGAAEGAMTAGNVQEQGRQAGRDWSDTAPSAVAAGALTAVIGVGTSKIPGFKDAEVGAALAGMGGAKRQGLITAGKEIAKGTFKEGVLEEMPQSAQEQAFINLALGKPWDEGVAEAAAQGMVAGAGMGGGMTTYTSGRNALAKAPMQPGGNQAMPKASDAPVAPQAPAAAPQSETAGAFHKIVESPIAATQTPARPEVRLAELELLGEQRGLSADEKAETEKLAQAMHAEDPAQQFEDVPELDQPAPATKAPEAARPYWDGFQTGDRVQTPHGTTGTLEISADKHLAYLIHDQNADGTPNTDGGKFSVTPQEVAKIEVQQPTAPVAAYKPPTDFWTFARQKGAAPDALKVGTPEWQALKSEFEMARAGLTPENPAYAAPEPTPEPRAELQNRDRSRTASVAQMADIAKAPDYMRLGTSRTPDSGAPMVFPVGDDFGQIPSTNFGKSDTAVMSDGQRVQFRYAVVSAHQVQASNFADGNTNPKFDSKEPGVLKALNNGRTAGLQAAYMRGKAGTYTAELLQDAQNHGVSAEAIANTVNPMLVRVYADSSNTPGMGAKSQGQGLGMAPGELARQDAPLLDATVLTAYRPGDVTSAANRDFVRAFIGKLRHHGQDVAGLMTADGTLSPAGRIRIHAALVQAAYGDANLVDELFDSQDSDIKGIGTALKTVAGQWADMRDSARMGAIDPQVDITGNLVQAVNLIRKSRQENTALTDLAAQVDLLTGQAPDPITVGLLRFFYRGDKHLSLPLSTEKVVAKLNEYVRAAMGTSTSVGMFDDAVTVDRILESVTRDNGATNGTNPTKNDSTGTDSSGNRGVNPDAGREPGNQAGRQDAGSTGESASELTAAPSVQEGDQGDGASQNGTRQRSKRNSSGAVTAKIEDAGQKIGGARKDRWKERGLDLSDLESMSESEGAELATKPNVWKPDYSAMVEAGTRPHTAAFIKVVYDSLAAKPKTNTPEGRRLYVTAMQQVRQVYTELAMLDQLGGKDGRNAMTGAAEALKVRLGVRSNDPATVKQGKALLFSVYKGRSDPFVVSVNEEMRARKLVADGFPNGTEPWKKRLSVVAYGGPGFTDRGLELTIKEADSLGTPVTAEQLKAGVYRVVSKAGAALAYLPTMADALAAAKTIYEGKFKGGASDKAEPARPHLDTLKRENLPQRVDRDVTADDLVQNFSFRGVEFGNWAAQDERQRILNMAYDGLRDLAEIMGVPPRAMSLNGSLGMAFGARGGGKFAAHYEPGKLVINMTKLQGGGSMAHEWAHALDHYLGELDRPDAYTTAARGASGWYTEGQYKGVPTKRMEQVGKEWKSVEKMRLDNLRPELAQAFDRLMSALFSGQETKAQMVRGLELQLERTQALASKETDPQTKAMYERMAKSQGQNLDEARQEPDDKTYPMGRSTFAKEAQKLSGKSANGYWTRPTEMFARAFEAWVFDKVAAMGAKSDYLVHGVEADRFAGGQYKGNPYPTGTERTTINTALDNLVKTIKTKETDKGVALYQQNDGGYSETNDQDAKPDDGPESARLIGLLERGVARAPGGTGADAIHPYVARLLPGHEQISAIAAAFGDTIQGFGLRPDLSAQERRQYGFFNGAYLKGTIYLRDIGQDRPHLAILGHEMTHRMAATQPDLYAKLVKAIAPYIDSKRYDSEFRKSSVARDVTSDARIQEEFIGEVLSDGFMETKFWRAVGNSNPSLLRKVVDFIGGLIDTIKAKVGYNRRTARILSDFDRVMEIAGGVMGEYGAKRTAGADASESGPAFNRAADIRFNRNSLGDEPVPPVTGAQANAWTTVKSRVMRLTSPESIDKLIYEFQDKFVDLKRIQAHSKELGGTITDLNDAYLGEELFHKRLAKRTEDFLARELKPLLAGLKEHGITLEQFETYLHARHAPEANKALAERNPNRAFLDKVKAKVNAEVRALELQLQRATAQGTSTNAIEASLLEARVEAAKWNGAQAFKGSEEKRLSLSGMSDADAAALIAGLSPLMRQHMDDLAEKVDAINSKTLDLLETYGLMDRAALSAWRAEYQYYVPLHRDDAQAESSSHPTGAGFSVKGSAAKSRTGSNEKVTHILGHIAMQREAALTRGEKNLVAKKLYLMAAQNPDDELWAVDTPPKIKTLDSRTGTVRLAIDPLYKTRPNVLMVRIAGKDVAIVFNEDNAQGMRLVSAMKNLDVGDLHVVLGLASKGTRWFASINTQYNPIFGLINFGRDLQEGMINLSTTPLQGKQLDVAKNVATAMRAIYRQERGKGAVSAKNQEWIDLWEEMQNVGGTTGYRDLYADAADRVKTLEKELGALNRGEVSKAAHAVVDWLSDYNEAMENAVRLSAYKVAIDSGISKERAASLAKNLTVNFNRKGRQTREIGALYAFFNAAVQGTARMAETIKGPLGQRIMLGGVAIGAVMSLVGMALMGGGDGEDDEWEKIPTFVKERSLIIPLSRTQYLSIPMPLGFKLFPNIGRIAMETAFGGPKHTAGKAIGDLLTCLVDSFNPLGGAQNLGQMVAPTVIDPVVALMENRDWTGKPIYRENNNPLDPQPGTKMVKDSASTPGRLLAEVINKITGGTNYRPGAWSPTPDQIDYVFGQLTGGLGRELLKANQAVAAQFTGDELPAYKIPLVGRLYGNTSGPAAESEQFYANVKALNEIENEIKGRMRHGENADEYRNGEPMSALVGLGNAAERNISQARTIRRMVVQKAEPGYQERVKDLDKRIGEVMANLNREVDKAQRKGVKP